MLKVSLKMEAGSNKASLPSRQNRMITELATEFSAIRQLKLYLVVLESNSLASHVNGQLVCLLAARILNLVLLNLNFLFHKYPGFQRTFMLRFQFLSSLYRDPREKLRCFCELDGAQTTG